MSDHDELELSVRLFAGLREAIGRERVSVKLARGARVSDLVDALAREHPQLERHRGRFAIAVNLEVARGDLPLAAGDEVALLPPVGGGSQDDLLELTREPIDVNRLVAFATHASAGGIAVFLGTARDVHEGKRVLRLEYEAYEDMARASFRELARSTRERVPSLVRLALVHRLGLVPIGEASVAVVASTPHRAEA
ncbi:molybdenum cofactor biosynthesis protein MoaE, partial [bacterium]|nr:molybdenum cofactor biosynthesis protein MoaE [bacterium]